MKARHVAVVGIIASVLGLLAWAISRFARSVVVLEPSGTVAMQQRDLFMTALIIMSIVALPVFVLLAVIGWKFRAGNKKAVYAPAWSSNNALELLWWGIPVLIVAALSIIAWQTSHSLDPYRPLTSDKPPVNIQVIALQWKWLFIYPAQSAASLNELYIPAGTPVEFSIASDAPMNSFWIPELGGQIYAMNGMSTTLHLEAPTPGQYRGMSSNLSGEGFADMTFTVRAVDEAQFAAAVSAKSADKDLLTLTTYENLAEPGVTTEPAWYKLGDTALYRTIIEKYTLPHSDEPNYTDTMNHEGAH